MALFVAFLTSKFLVSFCLGFGAVFFCFVQFLIISHVGSNRSQAYSHFIAETQLLSGPAPQKLLLELCFVDVACPS